MHSRWPGLILLMLSPAIAAHPFDPFAQEKQAARALIAEHLRAGDLPEALMQADAAIADFPKQPTFYALKAQILLRANRSQEALATIVRALDIAADDALSLWIRGLIYQQQGAHARAIEDFTQAIAREDDNPALKIQATGSRGMALVELGRYAEGLNDLNRAIEARPSAYAERQFRVQANLALARLPAAQADLDTLLEMNARDSFTHRLQGELQLKQAKPAQALTTLTRAIALNGKDAQAHWLRAQAHALLERPAARALDLKTACRLGETRAC